MARFTLTNFNQERNKGLWVNGPREATPRSYWRRQTGSHAIRERLLRTRDGTLLDTNVGVAHSLVRFDDVRFQGAGTTLFRAGLSVSTGLDGTPLDFEISEPRTGTDDEYLFHCGGGRLEKVDRTGTVTQWGIDAPSGGTWGTRPPGIGEDDSSTVVNDPQEKTFADTTSTTGWIGSPPPFLSTDGVNSPSGAAICQTYTGTEDDPQIDPDPGDI